MGTLTFGGAGTLTTGGAGSMTLADAEEPSLYPTPEIVSSQPATISLSMPAYLTPTAIPGLETEIIRVSDQTVFGGGHQFYRHRYAKTQAWNSNGSLIKLDMADGRVALLNGTTYELLLQFTANSEPVWSETDPMVLYGTGTGGLFIERTLGGTAAAPTQGTTRTVVTVPGWTGADTYIGVGEGHLSAADGRYVVLVGDLGADVHIAVIDIVSETVIDTLNLGALTPGSSLDWVAISPSGTYVLVGYNGASGQRFEVYDRATLTLQRTIDPTGAGTQGLAHADMGYDSAGNECVVIMDTDNTSGTYIAIRSYRLDNGAATTQLPADQMASNYHISCRNTARPGYAYVSTYADPGNDDTKDLWREIFALKLDGTGTIERFSQHFRHENPTDNFSIPGTLNYMRQSQATPNRDGSKVLFASDFGDGADTAIVYAYVVGVSV
jgi:hypothetical protein